MKMLISIKKFVLIAYTNNLNNMLRCLELKINQLALSFMETPEVKYS